MPVYCLLTALILTYTGQKTGLLPMKQMDTKLSPALNSGEPCFIYRGTGDRSRKIAMRVLTAASQCQWQSKRQIFTTSVALWALQPPGDSWPWLWTRPATLQMKSKPAADVLTHWNSQVPSYRLCSLCERTPSSPCLAPPSPQRDLHTSHREEASICITSLHSC